MKAVRDCDYTLLGTDGSWYVLESKPKSNRDVERLYLTRFKLLYEDGSFKYYNPIPKVIKGKTVRV